MIATLHPALIEKVATKHRLVQREGGLVRATDLILALCVASCIGPDRSIAEMRRQWAFLTSSTIARSSFDAHFDKPALGDSIRELLRSMMRQSNRALRRQWPGALRDLYDVFIDDGSRMRLRRKAADEFPATDENTAGAKLMARMSLGECKITEASVGAARTHDHALRPKTPFKTNALYLRDLGFYDHGEFAAICEAGAYFVSRWKEGVTAVVRGHASGLLLPEELVQEQTLDRGDVLGCGWVVASFFKSLRVIGPRSQHSDSLTRRYSHASPARALRTTNQRGLSFRTVAESVFAIDLRSPSPASPSMTRLRSASVCRRPTNHRPALLSAR